MSSEDVVPSLEEVDPEEELLRAAQDSNRRDQEGARNIEEAQGQDSEF